MKILQAVAFSSSMFAFCACRHDSAVIPLPPPVPKVCFERSVQPLYASYCSRVGGGCHDAGNPRVALVDYAGIMKGIKAGNPDGSWFFHIIGGGMAPWAEPQMSAEQVGRIRQWINEGALNSSCSNAVCETGNPVYANDIQKIFADYCDGCHGSTVNPNPLQFSNYDWARSAISTDPDRFLRSIRYAAGPSKNMPPDIEMNPCDRQRLEKWISQGMPK
jgi:hypothetical protein